MATTARSTGRVLHNMVTTAFELDGWPRRAFMALALGNLVLPSVYVSPYFAHSLGVMWPPGLYSAYHGFRADTLSADQSAGEPGEVGVQDGGSLAGKLSSEVVSIRSGARSSTSPGRSSALPSRLERKMPYTALCTSER